MKKYRVFTFHRLSLRIALLVQVVMMIGSLFYYLLWPVMPFWHIMAGSMTTGWLTYIIARRLLALRIDMAGARLNDIHNQQFDSLDDGQPAYHDEIDALIGQVHSTGRVMEKEIRRLQRVENHRREYIGNVSHELKTPIFAIHGFAETLLDGGLEDNNVNRAFVEKILRNAQRLRNLSHDLSEIARIETGELRMTIAPFGLDLMIREIIESLEHVAKTQNIILRCQYRDNLPNMLGDRDRIRQVLTNLVDNGIKYNNPGGYVEIIARELPSNEVKISIADNGIGILPEALHRITERFYRVDKSRSRSQGGTGLGLAIVKHILAAHNQELMIRSIPERGSTFSFKLPIDLELTIR